MTQELTSFADSDENHRILVAASDAEFVSSDSLEAEAATIKESMREYASNNRQIRTISTLDQGVFVKELREFQPHIVHFTNRGSAQPCIRMFDDGGWIRQITGKTIAKLFFKAECNVKTIILINCSVYRDEAALLARSDYILSIKNRYSTFGISPVVIRELYSDIGLGEDYGNFLNQFMEFVNLQTAENYFDFKVRAKEVPRGLSEEGRASFLLWEMAKSFIEPSASDDRGLAYKVAKIGSDERIEMLRGAKGTGSTGSHSIGYLSKVKEEGPGHYRVWFGTNRKPVGVVSAGEYGSDRDEVIHYGYCDVVVPKRHKIGQVSDSWLKRFLWSGESNSMKIDKRVVLNAASFFAGLSKTYGDLPEDEDNLLVFLHGYNVAFDQAALRAAQLGCDLSVKGTTAFFSWPSKGSLFGYMADEATIEASEGAIAEYLVKLSQKSGAKKIHLVAHSMGNRGLLRALNSMLLRVQREIGQTIDQIFLAAPDVDAKVFSNLAKVYDQTSNRTTMYVSAKDRALWGSGLFHAYERAGYTPPVTVVPNIDTVEVSNLNLDLLGHGYVGDAKEVLTDMHTLMTSDADPDKRFGLQSKKTGDDNDYWLVKA